MQNVLIVSVSFIKEITVIDKNIYDKLIRVEVLAVQDANLEPAIGTRLYKKILSLISEGTLYDEGNENYSELVDNYIVYIVSNFAVANMPQLLQHQISNTGVGSDLPQNVQKSQEAALRKLQEKYKDRAEMYLKRCELFLEEKGSAVYPEYYEASKVSELQPSKNSFRCPIHLPKKT